MNPNRSIEMLAMTGLGSTASLGSTSPGHRTCHVLLDVVVGQGAAILRDIESRKRESGNSDWTHASGDLYTYTYTYTYKQTYLNTFRILNTQQQSSSPMTPIYGASAKTVSRSSCVALHPWVNSRSQLMGIQAAQGSGKRRMVSPVCRDVPGRKAFNPSFNCHAFSVSRSRL